MARRPGYKYAFQRGSTRTVDNDTVLVARNGRMFILDKDGDGSSPVWRSQGTWYWDPANGNDLNSGETDATPIKTFAELSRRFGKSNHIVGQFSSLVSRNLISVYVMGSAPASDPVRLSINLPGNTTLAFIGLPTTLTTGTFSAVTQKNRATNTILSGTDVAVTWSSYIGKRIRIPSGANAKQIAWVNKDLGGGSASFSAPNDPVLPPDNFQVGTINPGTFSTSDPFVIEELPKIYIDNIDVGSSPGSLAGTFVLVFMSLELSVEPRNGSIFPRLKFPRGAFLKACKLDDYLQCASYDMQTTGYNCHMGAGLQVSVGTASFYGGMTLPGSNGMIVDTPAGLLILDYDHLVQDAATNGILVQAGAAKIGTACVFGTTGASTGAALSIGNNARPSTHATVTFGNVVSGSIAFWGSGNAGTGIRFNSGCSGRYTNGQVANFTATGTAGDLSFGTSSNIRAWDETANSGAGAYTASAGTSTTWANFSTAIGSGGLGGQGHDLLRNIHFVPVF